MIKVFVMETCPDCRQIKDIALNDHRFELIDIGEHVHNLKQFLALRDNNAAFDDAKRNGWVGIPCFVLENGEILFEMDELPIEGSACSLDGKGC